MNSDALHQKLLGMHQTKHVSQWRTHTTECSARLQATCSQWDSHILELSKRVRASASEALDGAGARAVGQDTDGMGVYLESTFSSFKAPHYASHRLQLRWGTQDAPHNACCILSALSKLVTVFEPSASLRRPRDIDRRMTPRK